MKYLLPFLLLLGACDPFNRHKLATAQRVQVQAERRADSLEAEAYNAKIWAEADLLQHSGQQAAQDAQTDETSLRNSPAATWSDDSLERFLARPNPHHLHAPGAGR